MFRLIAYLLVTVFLITVVRSIIGVLLKAFAASLQPSQPARTAGPKDVPLSGELKKDPVCGTYTPAAGSLQETVAGQTFYFCSQQCRDKYVASVATRA